MKYLSLILAISLVGCHHSARSISCRAVYMRPNSVTKVEKAGKWHPGMNECKILMVGLAIANTAHPEGSGRRQIEFKDASETDMIDLGMYYKSIKAQIKDEVNKQRKSLEF